MTPASDRAALAAWQRSYAAGAVELPTPLFAAAAENRGEADARAAWCRWHDARVDAAFDAREWPWYAVFERARVEILASGDLPGIDRNLASIETVAPHDAVAADWYQTARRWLAGRESFPLPGIAAVAGPRSLLQRISAKFSRSPAPSAPVIDSTEIAVILRQARDQLRHPDRFAAIVTPLARALAATPVAASPGLRRGAKQNDEHAADTHRVATGAPRAASAATADERSASESYAVFSRAWDEVLTARQLDALLQDHRVGATLAETANANTARRLAHRLQRRLLAARLRHWDFDQDEGLLDNRRLATLCTVGDKRNVFRREREARVPEACVTLLVDQSGSMRGLPQRMAVEAIDLAVRALEACRVHCEVLGYTTRFGADNPLVERWIEAGRPAHPGRLNALRHIVYKSALQPWRRAHRYLPLLANESPLAAIGENIDGEALEWAATRLRQRPEPRKVLVVLSDGTPFDEATVRANGRGLLETHLHSTIATIEASGIHLAAIGAGQEVGRFYQRALVLRQPAGIGELLFAHLADLLTLPADTRAGAAR